MRCINIQVTSDVMSTLTSKNGELCPASTRARGLVRGATYVLERLPFARARRRTSTLNISSSTSSPSLSFRISRAPTVMHRTDHTTFAHFKSKISIAYSPSEVDNEETIHQCLAAALGHLGRRESPPSPPLPRPTSALDEQGIMNSLLAISCFGHR